VVTYVTAFFVFMNNLMEYFTYILQSQKDGRYYYGQTQNLRKRLEDHKLGKSTYTKLFLPWKLFACKKCASRAEAMKFEKMLKNTHDVERMLKFIARHDFIITKNPG